MSKLMLFRQKTDFDVVVYGANLAGFLAAKTAVLAGRSVCVVEPTPWLGGVIAGGLCYTDRPGNGSPSSRGDALVGGYTQKFFLDLRSAWGGSGTPYYNAPPSRVIQHFRQQFDALGVRIILSSPIQDAGSVLMGVGAHGKPVVRAIRTRVGWITGRQFHDASYEFDLGAAAGVPYFVGRESVSTYGEFDRDGVPYAGFKPRAVNTGFVDNSGPFIYPASEAAGMVAGQGDHRIMAYNFRNVVTNDPYIRLAFTPPPDYDRTNYKIAAQSAALRSTTTFLGAVGGVGSVSAAGVSKWNTNNDGYQSLDLAGTNWAYPNASWSTRQIIKDQIAHWDWGFLYFLQHDIAQYAIDLGLDSGARTRLAAIQADAQAYGLCNDEFQDSPYTPGFAPALYARQTRLPKGKYTLTIFDQNSPTSTYVGGSTPSWPTSSNTKSTSVCVWNYIRDSKACWFYRSGVDGIVGEGYPAQSVHNFVDDFELPAEITLPPDGGVANLTFSCCHSASAAAYMATRLELCFGMLAEAAAEINCMSIDSGLPVQNYDYATLAARLTAHGAVLH